MTNLPVPASSKAATATSAAHRAVAAGQAIVGADALEAGRAAAIAEHVRAAEAYIEAGQRQKTVAAYAGDWRLFEAWARPLGFDPLPALPATVGLYLTYCAGKRGLAIATMRRYLAAIVDKHASIKHKLDMAEPEIRRVWKGILQKHGKPQQGKDPLWLEQIQAIVANCEPTVPGLRDAALVLLGFASALRRSELVGLDARRPELFEDPKLGARVFPPDVSGWIEPRPEGLMIVLIRSKGDRDAEGQSVAVPRGEHAHTCPVAAYERWIAKAKIKEGPVFRKMDAYGRVLDRRLSDRGVAIILKRLARDIGLDPRGIAGHSLRSGHASQADEAEADEKDIQAQLRHASPTQTRTYIRRKNAFRKSTGGKLGL